MPVHISTPLMQEMHSGNHMGHFQTQEKASKSAKSCVWLTMVSHVSRILKMLMRVDSTLGVSLKGYF